MGMESLTYRDVTYALINRTDTDRWYYIVRHESIVGGGTAPEGPFDSRSLAMQASKERIDTIIGFPPTFEDAQDWTPETPGIGDEYEFAPSLQKDPRVITGHEILLIAGPPHLSGMRIVVDALSDNEVLIDPDSGEMWSYVQDKPGSLHFYFDRETTRKLNINRAAIRKRLSFKPREIRRGKRG